ncbi:hypothetical protein GCM10025794_27130 [Massilia kyonggiensis]|nr:DUF4214 domain-containing protein [Massilia kyonggiensis]
MATTIETEVQQLYVAYFSRPADVAGLAYWKNILATNPDGYQMISANFAASAEYKAMYAGQDNRAIVSTVYQHLFGRPAETAGVDYWAKMLDNKVITIDNVVTQIAAGAQSTDKIAYDGKVAVAAVFTEHLDLTSEQQAYAKPAGMKVASDYIASIKDLMTAAVARDPGNIDITIDKMVSAAATAVDGHAEIVGVSDAGFTPIHG